MKKIIALTLAEKTPIPFQYLRVGTDLICVLTGFLLGQTIGIGTVLTAFFMGPVIAFFNSQEYRVLYFFFDTLFIISHRWVSLPT